MIEAIGLAASPKGPWASGCTMFGLFHKGERSLPWASR